MKLLFASLILVLSLNLMAVRGPLPSEPEPEQQEEPKQPPASSPKSPAGTTSGITKIIGNVGSSIGGSVGKNMGGNNITPGPDASGDFDLTNLTLSGGATFTSFDDTTIEVLGITETTHFLYQVT